MFKKNLQKKEIATLTLIFTMLLYWLFSTTVYGAKLDKSSPTAPTKSRVIYVTDTTIFFMWNPSKDNVGVKSYNIYRDSIYIGNSKTTTYITTKLKHAKTYKFYVKGKDAAGNLSRPSSILNVTTLQSKVSQIVTPKPTPKPTLKPTPKPTVKPMPTPTPTPTPTPMPTPQAKKVVGYYTSWSAYTGFTPDKIDAGKLTHINYAFANIGSDLKITMGYPDIDPSNFTKLSALKKVYPNLKTLISIGGWTWSGKFSDAALTETSRTAFANSCVEFVLKYGFDGVDVDWEYPVSGGLSSNIKRPEDKQNFTLLLKKVREKLNAQSLIDGNQYLLTFAGAASSWYVNNIELSILNQYLDYGNIMTYDIHGTWDMYTDFNAPLYNSSDSSPQYKWSVDLGVNSWLKAGFPADKIVLGVPFYGNIYNSVKNYNNGLYQTFTGGSSVTYSTIVNKYLNAQGFIRYFHQEAMVPWLFNGSTFISYEDETSIGLKGRFIKSKGLAGGMIWDISQDSNSVLLNSLNNGLK